MKCLFDLCHPAHVHLFKHSILELQKQGHEILVTARDKDIVFDLLDELRIPYVNLARPLSGRLGHLVELLVRDWKLFLAARRFKPDILVGTSVNIAHVGRAIQKVSIFLNEDNAKIVPLVALLAYPFSTYVVKPDCLAFEKGRHDVYHPSYHELAYLHPNRFTPDEEVVRKYGLTPGEYIFVRFSALQAHHDRGVKGLSDEVWHQIEPVIGDYKVVRSAEKEKTHEIDPLDVHHVLAYAKMVIADSQTMTIEAATLGVPAIRYNSFQGISVLDELEKKYRLTYGFGPGQEQEMVERIRGLLQTDDLEQQWMARRSRLLADKVDLTAWILDFIAERASRIEK
jgi:hypothetical protein